MYNNVCIIIHKHICECQCICLQVICWLHILRGLKPCTHQEQQITHSCLRCICTKRLVHLDWEKDRENSMIFQWCSCHPISKAGRAFRVTGCRPNVRSSRGCERKSRACEKNSLRLGVWEMVPGETLQRKFRPKGSRNMPPTRTAYRLGFVNAGKYCEVDFNGSPNR